MSRSGDLFRLFLAAYMAWRLGVDFLKPEPRIALGLSLIQWGALVTLAYLARDAVVNNETAARRGPGAIPPAPSP